MKAWPTSLALVLAACKVAPASVEPTPSADAPSVFIEARPQSGQRVDEDPPVRMISAGECPGEVADAPAPYFHERVLIRLPRLVTSDDLVEIAPYHAKLGKPVRLPTCKPERPIVQLEHMSISLLAADISDPLPQLRNQVLRAHGLDDGAVLIEAEVDGDRRHGEWVFSTLTSNRLVVLRSGANAVVVIIYEVAGADWPLVVETLRHSGKRVHILNP